MKLVFTVMLLIGLSSLAVDSYGILPLLVQVTDKTGNPIVGATVSLSGGDVITLGDFIDSMESKDKKIVEHSTITNKIGFAVIYYAGGTASSSNEFSCSFPNSIIVMSNNKKMTIKLDSRQLRIPTAQAVAPIIDVVFTPDK